MNNIEWKYVADLEVGERFEWVDRIVTLDRIELTPSHRYPSRWLHVSDPGGKAVRLNYRDNERVAAVR